MGAILTHSRVAFQNGRLPQAQVAWIICSLPYMQTVPGVCAHRFLALDVLVPLSLVLDHDGIPTTHGDSQKEGKYSKVFRAGERSGMGYYKTPGNAACSLVTGPRPSSGVPASRKHSFPLLHAENGDSLVHSSRNYI